MNKKAYIILILALMLVPVVSAQALSEGIERTLRIVFDATEDLVYIKAAIWFVLFFLIFKSAERIFPRNRGSAAIMALIVAVVGARYMPEEYLEYIGGWYAIILGIVFFLAPYFFGNIIGDLARMGRTGKTLMILAFYGALAYFFMRWEGIPMEGEAANALEKLLGWVSDNLVIALIIIGILCYFFLRRSRRGGISPPRIKTKGPGFWYGLGKGAGRGSGLLRDLLRQKLLDKLRRREQAKQRYQKPAIKKVFNWKQAQQRAAYQKPAIKARFSWFARRRAAQQAAQKQAAQAPQRKLLGWFARRRQQRAMQQRLMIEDKKWRGQRPTGGQASRKQIEDREYVNREYAAGLRDKLELIMIQIKELAWKEQSMRQANQTNTEEYGIVNDLLKKLTAKKSEIEKKLRGMK